MVKLSSSDRGVEAEWNNQRGSEMRTSVLGLGMLAALFITPAFAQSSNSISNSNAQSGSMASIVNNAPAVIQQATRSVGRLDTTASAFTPGLTAAGINSCAGSASAGVGGTGFNFGVGSTYEMQECTHRANAAALAGLGQQLAALEELCQSESMRRSLNASGTVCPSQRAEYIAAQQRANETGQIYVATELAPPPAPILREPRYARRDRRHAAARKARTAIAAQVSNSDASLGQTSAAARGAR